jgi:hypothetical protein
MEAAPLRCLGAGYGPGQKKRSGYAALAVFPKINLDRRPVFPHDRPAGLSVSSRRTTAMKAFSG